MANPSRNLTPVTFASLPTNRVFTNQTEPEKGLARDASDLTGGEGCPLELDVHEKGSWQTKWLTFIGSCLEFPCDRALSETIRAFLRAQLLAGDLVPPYLSMFAAEDGYFGLVPGEDNEQYIQAGRLFDFLYRSTEAAACTDAASRKAFHEDQCSPTTLDSNDKEVSNKNRGPHYNYLPAFLQATSRGRKEYDPTSHPKNANCACTRCIKTTRACFQFLSDDDQVHHNGACVSCWIDSKAGECSFNLNNRGFAPTPRVLKNLEFKDIQASNNEIFPNRLRPKKSPDPEEEGSPSKRRRTAPASKIPLDSTSASTVTADELLLVPDIAPMTASGAQGPLLSPPASAHPVVKPLPINPFQTIQSQGPLSPPQSAFPPQGADDGSKASKGTVDDVPPTGVQNADSQEGVANPVSKNVVDSQSDETTKGERRASWFSRFLSK